jgi:hypothetical protein
MANDPVVVSSRAARPGRRVPGGALAALLLGVLVAACQPGATSAAPTLPAPESTATIAPPIATTLPAASEEAGPFELEGPMLGGRVPDTCPWADSLAVNGGFSPDVTPWQARFGSLTYTERTYVSSPGSGLLAADASAADTGFTGIVGQCVDLAPSTAGTPAMAPTRLLAQVYLQGDPSIVSIGPTLFFHANPGCSGDLLDAVSLPAIEGGLGWIKVDGEIDVPTGTNSIDFVVYAAADEASALAAIDDFCVYPTGSAQR